MLRELLEFFRIVLAFTRPWSDYVLDFIYTLLLGKHTPLPPVHNKIVLMSGLDLAEKIRKKQLRCEEVVRAYVERARSVHSYINAVVDDRYQEAIVEAAEVDRFLVSTEKSEVEIARDSPLLGVPFSCKESVGVKGMTQTNGLVYAKDVVATEDSDAAALYRKAGAIPYVVTNVSEHCLWWEADNHIYGRTKNPYNHIRTPGGSSGGEGALIAAAASVIGIGSDFGGSIRIPSSFNCIYGHKPSRGVVSIKGIPDEEDWDDMTCIGPMCRYAQDLPLLTRLLMDNHPKVKWNEQVDFKNVKVFYMDEFPGFCNNSTSDIRKAVRKAAKHFEDAFNIQTIRVHIPEFKQLFLMYECRMLSRRTDATLLSTAAEGHINFYWELIKNVFRCSDHTLPIIIFGIVELTSKDKSFMQCLESFKQLKKKLEDLLDGDAILLLPTHPEPPPHILMTIPKVPNVGYAAIFNALGYPATQVPAGFSNCLPIGLQVVSRQYKDHLTVAAAVELDKVLGGWQSPCHVAVP